MHFETSPLTYIRWQNSHITQGRHQDYQNIELILFFLIFLKYLTARFTLLKRETEYNSKVLKTLGLQKADNSYDSDLHLDKERTCETQKVDISEKQKWSSNCSRALVCVHIHSLNVACKIKHSIMSRIKGEV